MTEVVDRYLIAEPAAHLRRPLAKIQPVLAKQGTPNIDIEKLRATVGGVAVINEMIAIESPEHWAEVIGGLGNDVDAILPVSIPAYPTEIWNSHPQPLVDRGLPLIFWPLVEFDEPDFWRWSARDFLQALGVEVQIIKNQRHGLAFLKALGMKRMLNGAKLVVFGEQNFPWNAHAAGHLIQESLGTEIVVKTLEDMRSRYDRFSDEEVDRVWNKRKGRYINKGASEDELKLAIKVYLSIRSILEEEQALGFGVNCYGDLIIKGGRDVPCLAQMLCREDGYIAACDGDFCAMMSMVLITYYLDKTCMMSNMYPVSYVGALQDHFGGNPLSPNKDLYARNRWKNMARLAHCGFIGVISPEMSRNGKGVLKDWGGTWEIKRDGKGCGVATDLRGGEKMTVVELCFDGRTLLLADGSVLESTHHEGMPHCESSALLEFRDLEAFVENISREHTAIVYGEHIEELQVLADVLGLQTKIF
ncbi:MAG: hypothetical protein K9M45_07460 [Kiritimatiellales bacterium]|nr:hypothetical protein [Kiritimatiellales bacterium]